MNKHVVGFLRALLLPLLLIFLSVTTVFPDDASKDKKSAISVQVSTSQGKAAEGNAEAANFLVVVTDKTTGDAIKDLTVSNFFVSSHFFVEGQSQDCRFDKVLSVTYGKRGAYRLKVGFNPEKSSGCVWSKGEHLAHIYVKKENLQGHATATLKID
ncbi:MAG: hypothetical protein JNN15_03410 [Blastocatellia bacterium]|nr:hypothetical protein [Blastocatellia bacterium]